MVTQVEVAADDPAMLDPSKPIGTFLDEDEATKRREEEGWDVVEDAGRGWRRVVASPEPVRIVEIDVIRQLMDAGVVVVCVGGGGIPVVADESGDLHGVAAVIDKDRTPVWQPATLAEVDEDLVARHFAPPRDGDLIFG